MAARGERRARRRAAAAEHASEGGRPAATTTTRCVLATTLAPSHPRRRSRAAQFSIPDARASRPVVVARRRRVAAFLRRPLNEIEIQPSIHPTRAEEESLRIGVHIADAVVWGPV